MGSGVSAYLGAADRPVFIGGCPRSGTTLLRCMLNSHPDVAIPRETRFLPFVWDHREKWRDLDDPAQRRALARLIVTSKWTRARRLDTPRPAALRRLAAAPPSLGSVLGTCFVLYAEATGKHRWGDKRPMYARYLEAIFTLFPDAQFINVIRDPRASLASMRTLGWFNSDIVPGLDVYQRSVRAVAPWRGHLHRDQLLDVRYEDLVTDPSLELARVAAFLDLSTDSVPTMLTYHEHVDETAALHPRLKDPVSTDSVRAWEKVLDPDEVALIEQVAAPWMENFGYDPVASGRPPAGLRRAHLYRHCRESLQRRTLEVGELKRLLVCRRPLAARLTSGQQLTAVPVAAPPFHQRHVGKPRLSVGANRGAA